MYKHNCKMFGKRKQFSSYPIAEFVMIFGFLLVLIIEQIVLSYKESIPELQPLLGHSHSMQNEEEVNNHTHTDHNKSVSHSSLRTLLLVFALSLHSIFEGLAIGLQMNMNDTLQIFIAVIIHKGILAFTLGLNLIQSNLNLIICIICDFIFSIMSPLGIGIGIAITDLGTRNEIPLTSGILQGIACGSFLYVTFFEVLPHELNGSFNRLLKLLFVILGFAGISIIIVFYQ
ncbi:zinc transporter ZIP1-like [Centruroides vittatus]|uniref:zinc transporter ZIP1-like n=1 Tax=Centruroides vittatus TaxID=120091 RepID=UPI003510C8B4